MPTANPHKFRPESAHVVNNRETFTNEIEKRTTKERNGMFGCPIPLTVGDTSTNY